jgi:hypothetical protein
MTLTTTVAGVPVDTRHFHCDVKNTVTAPGGWRG